MQGTMPTNLSLLRFDLNCLALASKPLLPSPFVTKPAIQNPTQLQQAADLHRKCWFFVSHSCCCHNGSRWGAHEFRRRDGEENRLISAEKRTIGRIGCPQDVEALQREHAVSGDRAVVGLRHWADPRSYRLLPFSCEFVQQQSPVKCNHPLNPSVL